jgi:hypothetical protein
MPRPQAGTPTDVALADVDTCIRLGIEGHSVRASHACVKYPSGGHGQNRPCRSRPNGLLCRARCRARLETRSASLPRSLRSPFSACAASRHPPPAAAELAQQTVGGTSDLPARKGERHLGRPATAFARPTTRARRMRHRARRGRARPRVAGRPRSSACRSRSGRPSGRMGR